MKRRMKRRMEYETGGGEEPVWLTVGVAKIEGSLVGVVAYKRCIW